MINLTSELAPNVWHYHPTEKWYFKWYMETYFNGFVDYISLDERTRETFKDRTNINRIASMRLKEFNECASDLQQSLDLLYEK